AGTARRSQLFPYTTLFRSVLGLKGSGIQEQGEMTFLVTDLAGVPAPNAAVTFSEATPALVNFAATTGKSGPDGIVKAEYSSSNRSEEHTSELQSRVDLVCR